MTDVPLLDRCQREVRELLAGGAPVYLTVNPVEYHGPHLPLRTDAIITRGLIDAIHTRLRRDDPELPLLVTADLGCGVDPVPGPGTQHTGYRTVRRRVIAACRGLHALGATRVVLATFHGSPLHGWALEAGVRWLRRRGVRAVAPMNLLLQQLLALDAIDLSAALTPIADPAARAAMAAELSVDVHGGYIETSLVAHFAPERVWRGLASVPPCPALRLPRLPRLLAWLARRVGAAHLAAELDYVARGLGWFGVRPFPGYTGRPALASAAAGQVLADLIAERFADCIASVFAGRARSPAPIMRWLPWLTLGGRVGHPRIPASKMLSIS